MKSKCFYCRQPDDDLTMVAGEWYCPDCKADLENPRSRAGRNPDNDNDDV